MNTVVRAEKARLCRFCYADREAILPGYLPIKYVYAENGEFTLSLPELGIPPRATHIYVAAFDAEMRMVHEEAIALDGSRAGLSGQPKARIAVISDLHTVQKGNSKRQLFEAFEGVREQKADLVISAGDNTNSCQQGEFEILEASVRRHLGGIPFFAALGNNDYFSDRADMIPSPEARERYLDGIRQQNGYAGAGGFGTYTVCFNGIHLLFLDCIRDDAQFRFDDETAEWLRAELEDRRDAGLRILVNHLPLANHNLGCRKKTNAFMAGNNKLQRIMDDSGDIVYISGHTHNRPDSDYPSAEQDEYGNTYLNAGSIGNTQPCFRDMSNLRKIKNAVQADSSMAHEINQYFKTRSMGLFLDWYENGLAVNGYDFGSKKWIPRCSFVFERSK